MSNRKGRTKRSYRTKTPTNQKRKYRDRSTAAKTPTRAKSQFQKHHGNCLCNICICVNPNAYHKCPPKKPKYPKNLKSTMKDDYDKVKGWDNPNYKPNEFRPKRSYKKSKPHQDAYNTIYGRDYEDKNPIPKNRSFKPENIREESGPFVGDTTYKGLTSSAKKNSGYSPVKRRRRKPKPRSDFKDNTTYQVDYKGKTPDRRYRDNDGPTNKEIFGGSSNYLGSGPMKDKTIYREDYTPKKYRKAERVGVNPFEQTGLPKPQYREKKTNYMREYTPKKLKREICDIDIMQRIPHECRKRGDHIYYDDNEAKWYNKDIDSSYR